MIDGGTFLIADDDPQFRQLMEEILLKIYPEKKVHVLHAATGAEAIAVFKDSLHGENPTSVVITDYVMPEGTGSDVIEYIMKTKPVPIIVVSAMPEAHTHDFIQEGAIYFLPKPFDIKTAKKVMGAALALNINPDDIRKAREAIDSLKKMNI